MRHTISAVKSAIFAITAAVCVATTLSAAPDPDIFDGRIVPPPSSPQNSPTSAAASGEADTADQSGAKSSDSSSTQEERDLNEVAQVGGGGVAGASTETTEGGSGGGEISPERNFEDFGFGSTGGGSDVVEVNRSKDMTIPEAGSVGTVPPPPSSPPKQSGGSGGSGGAKASGSGGGDYGSNLPSGL